MIISDGSFYSIMTTTILVGVILFLTFYLASLKRYMSEVRSNLGVNRKPIIVDPTNIFYLLDSIKVGEQSNRKVEEIYYSIHRTKKALRIFLILCMLSSIGIFVF